MSTTRTESRPTSVRPTSVRSGRAPLLSGRSGAILLMLAAAVISPLVDATAKAFALSFSAVFLTWVRFYTQTMVLTVAILAAQGRQGLPSRRPGIHLLRGVLFALGSGLFFLSLGFLGLAEAMALFFVQPIFVQILARVFLRERVGWRRWLGTLIGFVGALFVIGPAGDGFSAASLLPVGGALANAGYSVVTRAARDTDGVLTMQLWCSLSACALGGLALLAMASADIVVLTRVPTLLDWLGFAALGALTALNHVCMTAALQRAEASLLSPIRYVEVLVAVLIGSVWFGEVLDGPTSLGVALIVLGGLIGLERSGAQKGGA